MLDKNEVIKRLIANCAEIITEDEFKERIESGEKLTHYIGFEISGYVHIGQGIMSALVMKDLTDLGVKCTVWLADWHTAINEKLDGTKETAARIGKGYFTEAIKACFKAVGGDPEKLEFRLASEWYAKDYEKYWGIVMRVLQHTTQSRLQRSISIMGRKEGSEVDGAKLLYPAMQVADILYQGIDIAHAGMDQRKAHVILRDVAKKVVPDNEKPTILHHPLLVGLIRQINREQMTPQERRDLDEATTISNKEELLGLLKMSKSNRATALWVHDSESDITKKVNEAFMPPGNSRTATSLANEALSPLMNLIKNLLFWNRTAPFVIERKPEHGGRIEFETYGKLEKAYAAGEVHPMDLKTAVAKELIELLKPVREHFTQPDVAAKKAELDKILKNR